MTPTTDPARGDPARSLRRLLWVIWTAILFGLVMQGLILAAKLAAGAPFPGLKWLADLMSGVTWSIMVCGGVALGALVAEVRAALMGLLSFFSALIAFGLAKGVQLGVQTLVGAPNDAIAPVFYAIALLKAVEYSVLGALLALLLAREAQRFSTYAATGAAVGVVFGALIIALNVAVSAPKPPAVIGMALNEFLFPMGCAVIVHIGARAGRHAKALHTAQAPRPDGEWSI